MSEVQNAAPVEKEPPKKIEIPVVEKVTIVDRSADYKITPEDLNKLERMIQNQEVQIT